MNKTQCKKTSWEESIAGRKYHTKKNSKEEKEDNLTGRQLHRKRTSSEDNHRNILEGERGCQSDYELTPGFRGSYEILDRVLQVRNRADSNFERGT